MQNPLVSERRVVVTGVGLVSCLGLTLPEVTQSLRTGRSGVGIVEERVRLGFRSPLSGRLPAFTPSEHFSKKELKSMPEHVIYAALAVKKAFADSGTPEEVFDSPRAGTIIGNDSSAGAASEVLDGVKRDGTTQKLGSGAVVRSMNSSPTINLGSRYKIKGGGLTLSAACASGAHAVGLSYLLMKMGWTDIMLTGGCQELCWEAMAAFDALMAFSARVKSPAEASRPFDKERDGLVPSGGAGMLFLETLESARRRNARIYGEIIGYAMTSDGYHLTEPTSVGAERCIRQTLEQAGVSPRDIDYINAHATSTISGDLAEAKAINAVFGADCPPVSSTKSMTGHECWMSGASELIYCILMMEHGFVAPNINFTGFADDMPRINVTPKPLVKELNLILSNSFGFGGTNACILLKKFRE